MRILMVSKDAILGGMSRHCVDLCKALDSADVQVTLLVPRSRSTLAMPEIELQGLRTIRPASAGRVCSTEVSPGMIWRTLVESADIVHVHLPSPLAVLALLLRHRSPLIASCHFELDRRFGPLGHVYELAARRVLRRASAIIVATDHLRDSAILRGMGARIHTVPYGIAMSADGDTARIAADLRAGLDERLVLFVGRLVYFKGVDVLLRAMTRVHGTLVIVGDGVERTRLEELTQRLGLAGRVRFVGTVGEPILRAYYSLARVFVLPSVSRGEAFGIVQVEAALFGCPTVSTSLPGVSSVNSHGRTGIVVPPRDPSALAHAINTLLCDRTLAAKLGANARTRAATTFSPDTMAARILAIYRKTVAAPTQNASDSVDPTRNPAVA